MWQLCQSVTLPRCRSMRNSMPWWERKRYMWRRSGTLSMDDHKWNRDYSRNEAQQAALKSTQPSVIVLRRDA